MAYRKIIQMSPTTKVISMPSSWLSKNKIKKGDYVDVEECDNQIIIKTIKSSNDSIYADLSELTDDLLWTTIDVFYMRGYSNMQLKVTSSQKILLATIVKDFPMFIIASESKNIVDLKAVSNSINVDFDKTMQHMRHITNNMVDEALIMIEKKDLISLTQIKKMDYTLNTYVSMCFRHLSAGNIKNVVAWSQYVKILELYADRLCMLFDAIAKTKVIDAKDIIIIKRIRALYNNSFKLLQNFSIRAANEHDLERKSLEKSFAKSKLCSNFTDLTRSIYDIMEIIIQLHPPI